MSPEELQREEERIRAVLQSESTEGGFAIAPAGRLDLAVEVPEGCRGLFSGLLEGEWLGRLTQVGLGPKLRGFWSLALSFSEHGWATFEIRRMLCSSWSGSWFPEPTDMTTWPEGVRLDPREEALALDWETDLIGVVVDGGPDCLVLCFEVFGNDMLELARVAKRLDRRPKLMARYMADPKYHQGSPVPMMTFKVARPVTFQPFIFTPRKAGRGKHERCDPGERLFKQHWVVRMMRPPERKQTKKK